MQKLKTSSLITLIVLLVGSLAIAQDSETRSLTSFNGVSSSASVDVELVKGNKNEADITVKNIDLDRVVTEVKGGILKVGLDQKGKKWKWTNKKKIHVVVTYTDDLEYLSASSSSDMDCKDIITSRNLELKVSSSADMRCEVNVGSLEASASSSGDMEISGSADEANINVSSSADFLGRDLSVNDADLSASSSGDIEISVKNSVEARASSSGDITYYGNPTVRDIHKNSSGSVNKGR